jgi:hypothetical protein
MNVYNQGIEGREDIKRQKRKTKVKRGTGCA